MNNLEIKDLGNSEREITGELPAAEFAAFRAPALAHLGEHAQIPGFRPGSAPEAVLVKHVGEERLLMEMAELALRDLYPKIVETEKLDVIGRPEIVITKLAKDNPLGFKIKTAVTPKVKLPDYAKLAREENKKEAEPIVVKDEEVAEVLAELERNKADLSKLEDPKKTIRENLTKEKEFKARDKKRLTIMEAIIAGSEIPLPGILVESELDRMLAELKHDIERVGLKYEDYLKHLKKTAEEMRVAWRADAEKRVKTGLVLEKIREAEKLSGKPEEIEAELKHLASHYPDAAPERLRAHVEAVLANEAVWRFLEEQK